MHSRPLRNISFPSIHLGNVSGHLLLPRWARSCAHEKNEEGPCPLVSPHPVGDTDARKDFSTQWAGCCDCGLSPKQSNLLNLQVTKQTTGPPEPKEPQHLAAELGGLGMVFPGQPPLCESLRGSWWLWRTAGPVWARVLWAPLPAVWSRTLVTGPGMCSTLATG